MVNDQSDPSLKLWNSEIKRFHQAPNLRLRTSGRMVDRESGNYDEVFAARVSLPRSMYPLRQYSVERD